MLAVLVTGPTATQNSPFLSQRCPKPSVVVIASNKVGPSGLDRNDRPTKGDRQSQY